MMLILINSLIKIVARLEEGLGHLPLKVTHYIIIIVISLYHSY